MTADARRVIDGGRTPRGWEALWAKDEWHQRELPHGDLAVTYDREAVLRFGGLVQPWLKEAAKRWRAPDCWDRCRPGAWSATCAS